LGRGSQQPSSQELVLSLSESLLLNDRFNLSNSLLWNLLRLDVDPLLGGEQEALFTGLWRLLWDVLELALEYCLDDMFAGTLRCVGDVIKSDPGEVDKLGPSLLHSDTLRERHDVGFEHSETLRERLDL